MNYLIYQILKIKEFLMAGCLVSLVMMIVFLLWAVRPKRGISQYGWQAFFFRQGFKNMLYLNGCILQLLFAVTSVVWGVSMNQIHMVLLAAISVLKLLARPNLFWAAADAGYGGLLFVLLLVSNMLSGFIWQSRTDVWARVMYYLLSVFIIELAVYYFFKQLQHLLEERWNRIRRKSDVRE